MEMTVELMWKSFMFGVCYGEDEYGQKGICIALGFVNVYLLW